MNEPSIKMENNYKPNPPPRQPIFNTDEMGDKSYGFIIMVVLISYVAIVHFTGKWLDKLGNYLGY